MSITVVVFQFINSVQNYMSPSLGFEYTCHAFGLGSSRTISISYLSMSVVAAPRVVQGFVLHVLESQFEMFN